MSADDRNASPPARRSHAWFVVLGVGLLLACCQPISNRPDRLTLSADAMYGDAERELFDHTEDCAAQVGEVRHRQIGLGLAIVAERATGATLKGFVRALRGAPQQVTFADDASREPLSTSPYSLASVGASAGKDLMYMGFSAGLTIVSQLERADTNHYFFGQLRLGRMDTWWLHGSLGAEDPLMRYQESALGMAGIAGPVRYDVGMLNSGAVTVAGSPDPPANVVGVSGAFYGELEWLGAEQDFGVKAGAVSGPNRRFSLGLIGRFQ